MTYGKKRQKDMKFKTRKVKFNVQNMKTVK